MRRTWWIIGVMALLGMAGCVPQPIYRGGAVPAQTSADREGGSSRRSDRPPPVVKPKRTAHPYDPSKISTANAYQIGMSSYYGKKFHGRKTANGETFNMYKLTAAHRVLPLGTFIKVTNLANGHWVEVKVNDRGPFIEGRVLDLSYAAALELEMVKAGTAKVMIEIVRPVE